MIYQPLTGVLIGGAMLQTFVIMIVWHCVTRGAWFKFPAGRVLMGLLGIMLAILVLATTSSFYPMLPFRAELYVVLYTILNISLAILGVTIVREQKKRGDR